MKNGFLRRRVMLDFLNEMNGVNFFMKLSYKLFIVNRSDNVASNSSTVLVQSRGL